MPTVYWVHLKLPRMRPVIGFLALIPFVVAPIILVVGLLDVYRGTPYWFYGDPHGFLVAAYVILAFPYMYFSLDTGFRSIDVHTLTEASQSLGAGWPTTLLRVILPNIKAAALAGSFLTLAIVMGEYTIASLSSFNVFSVYVQYINQNKAYPAAAVTLLAFGITWAAMLALRDRRPGPPGACRRGGALGMADVELKQLHRRFGEVVALAGHRPRPRDRRVRLAARAVGLRQDDRAAARRRLRPADLGPGRDRRQGRDRRAAEPPRHRAWSSRPTASSRT